MGFVIVCRDIIVKIHTKICVFFAILIRVGPNSWEDQCIAVLRVFKGGQPLLVSCDRCGGCVGMSVTAS